MIPFVLAANIPCLTPNDVFKNQYSTYQNKVYDLSKYTTHPAGSSILKQAYSTDLAIFFKKYPIHLGNSKVNSDLKSIFVGTFSSTCGHATTYPFPTTVTSQESQSTSESPFITETFPVPTEPLIPNNSNDENIKNDKYYFILHFIIILGITFIVFN